MYSIRRALNILLISTLLACSSDDNPPPSPQRLYQLGTTISPRGNLANATTDDFIEYYSNHAHGEIRAFHLAWRESAGTSGQIPANAINFMTQQPTYGFIPVVGFGWSNGAGEPLDAIGNPMLTSDSEPANNTWSNTETRNELRQMVTNFADQYKPAFLFLGNETNSYFVTHTQNEWDNWVSLFEECYDAIKSVSPATVVYTTFQLEKMKGLGSKTGAT
jgi:hypothetical protein